MVDAVVIGAGPYGLSVAAHLRGLRIPFRIFGKAMVMWQEHMPKGMVLKSEPFASTRRPAWWFDSEPERKKRPLADAWQRIRRPMFGLGPGWRTWFYSEVPHGYRFLPTRMRLARAYGSFGPAGSGWLKHRIAGVVPVHSGALRSVEMRSGEVRLSVEKSDGALELPADHVIAATGYKADIRRLPFLEALRGEIACVGGVPVLDQGFQSTAKRLRFVGFMSAGTFGPSMRFIYGTRFAARRVAGAMSRVGASRIGAKPISSRLPA